jgi:hypothetical protein
MPTTDSQKKKKLAHKHNKKREPAHTPLLGAGSVPPSAAA